MSNILRKNSIVLKISITILALITAILATGLIYKLGNVVGSLISGGCI